MKIQAAVVYEKGQPFQIQEVDLAAPRKGELLVKIVASGVCHTDAVAQHQGIPVPLPAVLGHEGCGIVEQTGEGVTEFQVGDRVGFSFGYCGHCENCLSGRPYACGNFNVINFGGVMADGTKRLSKDGRELSTFFGQSSFATYAVVSADSAVRIPEDVELALAAPLGCGIQTGAGAVLNRLRPMPGTAIAVFGCGTVGMSAIMAAKIAGCTKIIAVGGNSASLQLALELGATHVINRRECGDIPGKIREITDGGAHYSIDTTGVGDFVKKALACLRFLGVCVTLAGSAVLELNIQEDLMGDAKSLVGIVEGDSVPKLFIPILLDYYRQGKFPFDRLIRFYDFQDINQAFEDSHNGKTIKAVLKM